MKNTAMHKCYLVQPTNMRQKLNIELFCKFGKVKVTVPSPLRLLYKGVSCSKGGGGGSWSHVETQNISQFSKKNFSSLGLYMVREKNYGSVRRWSSGICANLRFGWRAFNSRSEFFFAFFVTFCIFCHLS